MDKMGGGEPLWLFLVSGAVAQPAAQLKGIVFESMAGPILLLKPSGMGLCQKCSATFPVILWRWERTALQERGKQKGRGA